MPVFAWILLLAASTNVDLVDEVYRIPAREWRYIPIELKQNPAVVWAQYEVQSNAGRVRLALIRQEDLWRLREGLPHGVIDETPLSTSGTLPPHVRATGNYVLVVDNPGNAPIGVRLRVSLDFRPMRGLEVTQLSSRRQLTVIVISFAVFFGIVTWSARRLLRALDR